jgi:hypothetical protein
MWTFGQTTTNRVPAHTVEAVNRRIAHQAEQRIDACRQHPEQIERRLRTLDREWDIERSLEANAATVCIAAVLLGLFVNRKWLVLPGLVGAFLLQHAIEGWCPPLPILRRLGFRTQTEIERERYALKALRGDGWSLR